MPAEMEHVMRRAKLLAIASLLGLLMLPCFSAAWTVHITTDNRVNHADCNGGLTPGGTDLLPLVWWLPSKEEFDEGIAKALRDQYPSWDGTNATYTWGANLKGDLYVDWYKATDTEIGDKCRHGAELTMHYVRHADDPANLDWIQLFRESGDSGNRHNQVDPSPRDDNKPFYFTDADVRNKYTHIDNLPGVVFGDSPGDRHPEASTFNGTVKFLALLASWSTDQHILTLHNVIEWGYHGYCVPLPLAWQGGMAVILILVLSRARRRSPAF